MSDLHKKKSQARQKIVREKIKQATEKRGILIVVTGNGKGKSTSGFGTVARCVGHGQKASVVQFIKGKWQSGERNLLEPHGVEFAVMNTGFTWDTQDRNSDIAAAEAVWQDAKRMLSDDTIQLVLLDELTYMLNYKYLEQDEVLSCIRSRPIHQTVIVTGRGASSDLIEMADTVSHIQDKKHAFNSGIKAQKGIDW